MLSKLFNLPWPPEFFFPDCPCCAPPGDTPWCSTPTKLALQSGQFTSTIKTSEDIVGVVTDISWDGTNTPWSGRSGYGAFATGLKLVLQSGQFTSTIKTSSEDIEGQGPSAYASPHGISWDGTNTPWAMRRFVAPYGKLVLQSGQFTSTIKTSEDVGFIGGTYRTPHGISWDGTNTPWAMALSGQIFGKLALQSGQFTSTIKTSEDVGISPTGISWDGTNTLWANPGRVGVAYSKLVLQSGQFTSTIKTSERLALQHLRGINTNKRTTG